MSRFQEPINFHDISNSLTASSAHSACMEESNPIEWKKGWMDGWMDECHHILKVRFFTFVYIFIMEKILLIMTNFHIIHFSSRKIELSLHALGLTLFLDWKAAAIAPRIFSFRERARLCCLLWCANRTINYSPTLDQVTPAVPGARSLRSHIHLVEIKTSPTKGKEDTDPQEHY